MPQILWGMPMQIELSDGLNVLGDKLSYEIRIEHPEFDKETLDVIKEHWGHQVLTVLNITSSWNEGDQDECTDFTEDVTIHLTKNKLKQLISALSLALSTQENE